ncbi:hypothetical protein C8A05DRAFT_37887 [Staphylotrichum tortipilum]|uniref:Clr5 domain-containing protein n=1 Tax=Staphylotrichum tortipilum TaxID=2831512 RepID=A0AAN6MDZ1_9PEZI|nr:hypothetical protein C8A05DRAFT_37887 [Staphylotrichum longicolle]
MSVPFANTMPGSSAGPEGKSRTLQGPSADEWARHRETIVGLYKQYPLKRVSEVMRRDHGFSASKRMYDKRFREWNVFKNVNNDDRARAARRARRPASPAAQGGGDNDTSFNQEDLGRTLQCARTIQQEATRAPAPVMSPPPSPIEGQSPPPQASRQARRSISISDLIKQEDTPLELSALEYPGYSKRGGPSHALSPPETRSNSPGSSSPSLMDDGLPEQENCTALVVPGSPGPGPGLAAYRAQLQHLSREMPPSISPDLRTRTMSIITLNLGKYYDWQLDNIPQGAVPDDYLGLRSTGESTRYWSAVKDAIYLVKISSGSTEELGSRPDRRAWSAFAEAGSFAAGAMTSQPFDFLRNVFATLSPANTSARPELRDILLRFLASEAQKSLSSSHPITQICGALQQDQGCQEISQRSLQCMLNIFNNRLGRSRAITLKLLDSLATLLRRSGQYQAGLDIITELLNSSRSVFGSDSDHVRSVENELAHFYMLTDESDLALAHCMSVVTRPLPDSAPASGSSSASSAGEPAFYQDGIAAHAMEDIAEIHQRRGDMEQCIAWLERAASIALVVWGPRAVATGHLIDKMTALQRQMSRDLLRSATMWESAVDPE